MKNFKYFIFILGLFIPLTVYCVTLKTSSNVSFPEESTLSSSLLLSSIQPLKESTSAAQLSPAAQKSRLPVKIFQAANFIENNGYKISLTLGALDGIIELSSCDNHKSKIQELSNKSGIPSVFVKIAFVSGYAARSLLIFKAGELTGKLVTPYIIPIFLKLHIKTK